MSDKGNKNTPEQVRFIYSKARHHRTFHADGAWAGVTPQLEVQFAFFNDLRPMPEEVTHKVRPDGGMAEEVDRQHNVQDVNREVNVTITMNPEVAKSFIAVLVQMINQAQEAAMTLAAQQGIQIIRPPDEPTKVP